MISILKSPRTVFTSKRLNRILRRVIKFHSEMFFTVKLWKVLSGRFSVENFQDVRAVLIHLDKIQ